MRDFATSADQPPMVSINVFELAGEERRKLRLLMLPIGMLLKPGFRVIIDKGEPIEGKYDMCFQNACSAEIDIGASTLASLKKAQTLSVVMRVPGNGEPSGRELTFNIPLKDFGPSFDGKPTDPKLLEQQRQQLQQQLQKGPRSSGSNSSSSRAEPPQHQAPQRLPPLPRRRPPRPPLSQNNSAAFASNEHAEKRRVRRARARLRCSGLLRAP